MKNIIIDFNLIDTKEEFHNVIKKAFDFPDCYGANLDAFWDLIMEINIDTKIYILGSDYIIDRLGNYGESIVDIFNEASLENSNIFIKIE